MQKGKYLGNNFSPTMFSRLRKLESADKTFNPDQETAGEKLRKCDVC